MNEAEKEAALLAVRSNVGLDTDWQKWVLKMTDKGAGLDASPGAMTNTERKECDALVAAGLLRKTQNHSKDKYGMYIKASNVELRGCALLRSPA